MSAPAAVASAPEPVRAIGRGGEQSRARYPDEEGPVERDGQRVFYELYGEGEETVFFLPTWSIVHARHWKMQLAYFARHFRVLVADGLGNGRADRCRDPHRYAAAEFACDCLAAMDATATERALIVSESRGAQFAFELARLAPERVAGAAFVGPMFPYTPSHQWVLTHPAAKHFFKRSWPAYLWWGHMNHALWREDFARLAHWFIERSLPEPHSTKAIEDGVEWILDTDPDTLAASVYGGFQHGPRKLRRQAETIGCPVLVVSGDRDKITPHRDARMLARFAGGRLERVRGAGHFPHTRKPVQVNLALRDFAEGTFGRERTPRDPTVYRPDGRPRALFVSSPIGLGHAQRDVAIARELRQLNPDLEVHWLAQDPVTRMLEAEGERIHPASEHLANESKHIESESAEHDLHCFHALRRMDETSRRTSCCSTTSFASSATTSGSATRPGSSTTTCTRTRGRSAPRSCG